MSTCPRAALLCLALAACGRKPDAAETSQAKDTQGSMATGARDTREPSSLPKASVEVSLPPLPPKLRYLAFGGGSDPASNQISLAQDLAQLHKSIPGTGLTLFASGARAPLAVQRSPLTARTESLGESLTRIFGTPGAEHVLTSLERALQQGREPLLVYGATHGDQGEDASENSLVLWGGWDLRVRDLAELLDRTEHARPTRFVLTACYGGGFADLLFRAADPRRGPRAPEHCGLFAAPWDDEASGCDPSPDRRAQESFSIHFLHALRNETRSGAPLPASADLNGDGRMGLLEAHAFARVASHSFDIPTTTSERYLRSLKLPKSRGASDPATAPEDAYVALTLAEELGLADEQASRKKLAELDAIAADVRGLVKTAQGESDDAYYALRIALVERWPVLAHPWEERYQLLLTREHAPITELLNESDLAATYEATSRELDDALAQQDTVRIARARVMRLLRAQETLRLATALQQKGGAGYAHFQALRDCESFVPSAQP